MKPSAKHLSSIRLKFLLIFFILICTFAQLSAQVSEIKNSARSDRQSSKSSRSSSSGSDDSSSFDNSGGFGEFLAELFFHAMIMGVYHGQVAALDGRDEYCERISLELPVSYGTDVSGQADYLRAGLRANWGIFASDVNYLDLADHDDHLRIWDWQVLIIRIPIQSFKMDFGVGTLYFADLGQSYANVTYGFDWRLIRQKLNISARGDWAGRSAEGDNVRRAYRVRLDYEALTFDKIHISPFFMYSYQNYFEHTQFDILNMGLVMKLY